MGAARESNRLVRLALIGICPALGLAIFCPPTFRCRQETALRASCRRVYRLVSGTACGDAFDSIWRGASRSSRHRALSPGFGGPAWTSPSRGRIRQPQAGLGTNPAPRGEAVPRHNGHHDPAVTPPRAEPSHPDIVRDVLAQPADQGAAPRDCRLGDQHCPVPVAAPNQLYNHEVQQREQRWPPCSKRTTPSDLRG